MRNQDGEGEAECPGGRHLAAVTVEVAGVCASRRLPCLGIVSGIGSRLFCQLWKPPEHVT